MFITCICCGSFKCWKNYVLATFDDVVFISLFVYFIIFVALEPGSVCIRWIDGPYHIQVIIPIEELILKVG